MRRNSLFWLKTGSLSFLFPAVALGLTVSPVGTVDRVDDAYHFHSPDRSYVAEVEYSEGNSEFVPFSRITVKGPDGEVAYSLENTTHTLVDLADNGAMVGIDFDGPMSGRARLHFYSPNGHELGAADIGFLNQREFAGAKLYYVNDGLNGVRSFDGSGRELRNLGKANYIAVSTDGKAAIARDDEIGIAADGRETVRIPLDNPFVRGMSIAGDGTFGYVDRFKARVYSDGETAPLFTWQPPEGYRLISIDIEDGMVLVGADDHESGHRQGAVFMLDLEGSEVGRLNLSYEAWNSLSPGVRIAGDKEFEVTTTDGVSAYRWEEE
ncbi:MAG: hypothetical protein JSU73_05040 [candidate division WOR-3 bacterium]|nr:MAG: hypothetical protein JSU73_05040 [candidate division WOR-3 bacterium]